MAMSTMIKVIIHRPNFTGRRLIMALTVIVFSLIVKGQEVLEA